MGNHVEVASHQSESAADDNDESDAIPMEVEDADEEEHKTPKKTSGKAKANKEAEESGSADEEQQYEVEKILKSRTVKGEKEYFVHWKGFPASEDSWEPEANLGEGCADLLEALKENEKKKQVGRRGRSKSKSTAAPQPQTSSSSKTRSANNKDDSDNDEKKKASRRYEETADKEDDGFEPTCSKKTKSGGKKSKVAQDTLKRSFDDVMAEADDAPTDHAGDEDAAQAQATAEEASASDIGPPACQVTLLGQLLPRFDIAPYVEGFKHGLIPGIRQDIIVSLEEAFAGCTRRMTINSGNYTHAIDVLVYPGTLAGHQWVYPLPYGNTVTITLKDARRVRLRRDGSDLIYTHRLPLRDALLGARFNVELFTGEVVKLALDSPVFSGVTKRIAGYGMPLPSEPWTRGDLVVEFDVKFPNIVSDEFHAGIKELL